MKPGDVLHVGGSVVGEGSRYLGYGIMEAFASRKKGTMAGQLTAACLRAPVDFRVHMRIRARGLSHEERVKQSTLLRDALATLGTLGCMGAKSRKGYGSLNIRSLLVNGASEWRPPSSLKELSDAIGTIGRRGRSPLQPEYTALSGGTRFVLVSSEKTEAMELLNLVGRELMRYRSWGHNGMVLGQRSERNFKPDHDLMASGQRNVHPRRIAFGLPHDYGNRSDQRVGPFQSGLDRRASPLFIHIHECSDTPVAVLSFLPARFLPQGSSDISVGGRRVRQAPEADLYRPVHDFLDRLLDESKCREQLRAEEIKP